MVSEYNKSNDEKYPIKNIMQVVTKRLTFRGFIVSDKNSKISIARHSKTTLVMLTPLFFAVGLVYFEEHHKNVSKWLHDGSFKATESITDGIDNAPEGFVGMLQGKNFGKAVLKIADIEVRDAKP